MQKQLITLLSILLLIPCFSYAASDPVKSSPDSTAIVHLLRPKDHPGLRQTFNITSNQGHEFKFRQDSYKEMPVKAGGFALSIKYALGTKANYYMELEAGKEYYLIVTTRPDIVATQPFIVEVTPRSFAREKLKVVEPVMPPLEDE